MIERFERFSYAISEISRYWHKLSSDEMEKHGLRSTHSVYLLTLLHYPDGLSATRLRELCGKDKSDVSRMISIMESNGLVEKVSNGQNVYRCNYKLTDKGMRSALEVKNSAMYAVQVAGQDMSDEEREIFYNGLESIASNLRDLCRTGIPEDIRAKYITD